MCRIRVTGLRYQVLLFIGSICFLLLNHGVSDMYLCQPLDLLHNLRNSKLMGTLLYAGHTGTASAGRRALFYSQIELSEGPVILSQKKVVILPENRPIRSFGEFVNLSAKWVAGCAGVVILNGKECVIA